MIKWTKRIIIFIVADFVINKGLTTFDRAIDSLNRVIDLIERVISLFN